MPIKAKPAFAANKPKQKEIENENENERGFGRNKSIIRNATTEVVVRINQKQSLNIVQTSVAASLSTILFIKKVFPDSFYEHQSYNFKSADFKYSLTPTDARSIRKQDEDENTVTWDMLVAGKHKHVDKMLYWLEGIGEAIKLQYLASFVISLHHGHIAPETLAEAYVLNFSYKGLGQKPQVGLTMGNETVDITLQNQQDMKSLFNRLLRLANAHKIDLPEHPAIGMQLTYNETCPEEYEPSGFRAAPPSKWIEESGATVVGKMDSGYHKLEMRMIPPAEVAPLISKTPRQPASVPNLDSSPPQSQLTESGIGTPQRGPRRLVHRMVPPRKVAPDTQLASGLQQDIRVTVRDVEESSPIAQGRHEIAEPGSRVFCFDKRGPTSLLPEIAISAPSVPVIEGGADCMCARVRDDEAHACQGCGVAQHRKCYGFVDNDTVKTFFCYACLLKNDQPLLRQMKEICQLRSFLAIIAIEGYPLTEGELGKSTGYLVKEVKAASSRLTQEGYLIKTHRPNEKKGKSFRKGPLPPPFEFDETQRERLLNEYWNPAYKIVAYVHTFHPAQIYTMMKQPKVTPKATPKGIAIPPTPPSSKPQPAMKPTVDKSKLTNNELSLDDDDDDDDDLSSSRRRGDFSSIKETSSRADSPVAKPPTVRKRKRENLEEQGRGKKTLKRSFQTSPFAL